MFAYVFSSPWTKAQARKEKIPPSE